MNQPWTGHKNPRDLILFWRTLRWSPKRSQRRGAQKHMAWLVLAAMIEPTNWSLLMMLTMLIILSWSMLVTVEHTWSLLIIVEHTWSLIIFDDANWSSLLITVDVADVDHPTAMRCGSFHSLLRWMAPALALQAAEQHLMNFQSAWLTRPLASTLSINLWSLRAFNNFNTSINHLEPWPSIRWLTIIFTWSWPWASTWVSSAKIAWFQQWNRYITWPLRTWFSTPSFFSALVTNRCRGRFNNNQSTTENNECQPCWTCCRWMFDHQVVV